MSNKIKDIWTGFRLSHQTGHIGQSLERNRVKSCQELTLHDDIYILHTVLGVIKFLSQKIDLILRCNEPTAAVIVLTSDQAKVT